MDSLERELEARIDYEKALLAYEYRQREKTLNESHRLGQAEMGSSWGFQEIHRRRMEELSQEFTGKNELMNERHQIYRDNYANGTYKPMILNPEREAHIEAARMKVSGLYSTHGNNIPEKYFDQIRRDHGGDILDVLVIRERDTGKKQIDQDRIEQQKRKETKEKQRARVAELHKKMIENQKMLDHKQEIDFGQSMR